MEGWALATSSDPKQLAQRLRDALPSRGQRVIAKRSKGCSTANIYKNPDGAHVIVEYGIADLALARTITEALGAPMRFLELRLHDAEVSATLTELPGGATEDLDDAALEILNDWNEGEDRKFISEAFPGLAEALLDLEGHGSDGKPAAVVYFESAASPRVAMLLRQIEGGSKWERTTIAGQAAIRVSGPAGTQISVLTADEQAEFLAAVGVKS